MLMTKQKPVTVGDFWLSVQRRNDLWEVMNSPNELARIERANPVILPRKCVDQKWQPRRRHG
jgi:hypothetical protein